MELHCARKTYYLYYMILRKENDYFLYLGNQLVFVEAVYVYSPLGT
jgi:hypothetical protein